MKHKKNSLLQSFFLKILPISLISNLIDKEHINKCLCQVSIGQNSAFYPEARVENHKHDSNSIKIGVGTHIRGELTLYPYAEILQIGDNSYIGRGSVVRSGEKIIIGNNVLISHGVTIIDSDSHEINYLERAESYKKMLKEGHPICKGNIQTKPITIEDYVWISYGVSILKGVTIGKGSIVAAGSVVTIDVPPFTMVGGNPIRVIKIIQQ